MNLQVFTLIEPLDVVAIGVSRGMEVKLFHHALWNNIGTLLPSMIIEQTFPRTIHQEWKMFSRCSSLVLIPLKALLKTSISPSSTSCIISSWFSSYSSIKYTSFSSSISFSLTASNSTKVVIFLFGQSEAMWPSLWYLKHLLVFIGLGLGLFCGTRLFSRAWVFMG